MFHRFSIVVAVRVATDVSAKVFFFCGKKGSAFDCYFMARVSLSTHLFSSDRLFQSEINWEFLATHACPIVICA